MVNPETVKIKHPDTEGAAMIINQDDFDETIHELFVEQETGENSLDTQGGNNLDPTKANESETNQTPSITDDSDLWDEKSLMLLHREKLIALAQVQGYTLTNPDVMKKELVHFILGKQAEADLNK